MTATTYGLTQPGITKAIPRERCTTCGQRSPREELVRYGGECFACESEREIATSMLDTND